MKNRFIFLFILYPVFIVHAQKQEQRELKDFNRISVKDHIVVNLKNDSTNRIDLRTDRSYTGLIHTKVNEGLLEVKFERGADDKEGNHSVNISYTDIKEINGAGPSEVNNEGILKADSLKIDLRSGSNAYLYVDVKYMEVKLREGAMLYLEGYADEQQIKVSTSATYSGLKCESDNIYVDLDTKGQAKVNASEKLTGTATTWSHLCYKGEPGYFRIESKMNSSIVKCTD